MTQHVEKDPPRQRVPRTRAAGMALVLAVAAAPALALADVRSTTFRSPSLGKDVAYVVDLPDSYATGFRRYPVVYALHGLFESPSFWERRGLAPLFHDAVTKKEFPEAIVVAVDGGNTFFVNGPQGKYEDLVVKDLVSHVESTYRTAPGRDGRALLGISMGGYAALRIALTHPDLFGAVATHSAMLLTKIPSAAAGARQWHMQAFHAAFGDPIDESLWAAADPLRLAEKAGTSGLPALSFDCGASDRFGLSAGNTELHRRLEARGVAHRFELLPGDHGYEYVRASLPASLRFLAQHLQKGR